jgi:hypothetical protein
MYRQPDGWRVCGRPFHAVAPQRFDAQPVTGAQASGFGFILEAQ